MTLRVPTRRQPSNLHPMVACLAAAFAGAPLHAGLAADLPVTSCADDGSPGTLRSVIDAAIDGDTIDLTQLACSTITLSIGPIDSSFLGPHPLDRITLQGPGRDALTISGGGAQIFRVNENSGSVFTVNDLTLAHGTKYDVPACIDALSGTVALNRATVTDCHSTTTGGFRGGGAIGTNDLDMTDSTISASSVTATGHATAAGGGAWTYDANIVRSTISDNHVSAPVEFAGSQFQTGGGGLYVMGTLTLVDSTISGNSAEATDSGEDARAGGAWVTYYTTIIGSTIEGNSTDGDGGGLFSTFGPIPFAFPGLLTIRNSTISGNNAGGTGGAFATPIPAALANTTVAFNSSPLGGAVMFRLANVRYSVGTLDLASTIIADNTVGAGAPFSADLGADDSLTVTGANNLVMAADPAIVLPADTLHADPRLLTLTWNGGPTRTQAITADSPAIDTGNNDAGLATDQRGGGYARVYGAAADIGAFELQPVVDAIFADGFDSAQGGAPQ